MDNQNEYTEGLFACANARGDDNNSATGISESNTREGRVSQQKLDKMVAGTGAELRRMFEKGDRVKANMNDTWHDYQNTMQKFRDNETKEERLDLEVNNLKEAGLENKDLESELQQVKESNTAVRNTLGCWGPAFDAILKMTESMNHLMSDLQIDVKSEKESDRHSGEIQSDAASAVQSETTGQKEQPETHLDDTTTDVGGAHSGTISAEWLSSTLGVADALSGAATAGFSGGKERGLPDSLTDRQHADINRVMGLEARHMLHKAHAESQINSILMDAQKQESEDQSEYFSDDSWRESSYFCELAREFHDHYYMPIAEMTDGRRHFDDLLSRLQQFIKNRTKSDLILEVDRFEKQGSSEEDNKVRSSEMEFDCLCILKGGEYLEKVTDNCPDGFTKLRVKDVAGFVSVNPVVFKNCVFMDEEGFLTITDIYTTFMHELFRAFPECNVDPHGPAAQLDVYVPDDDATERRIWYTVDMVPAFEIPAAQRYELYVPKPLHEKDNATWRQSYPLEEKHIMSVIDRDGGCRKPCLRILKVLSDIYSPLDKLCTYHMKTTVLNMTKSDNSSEYWAQENMGRRLVDCIAKLREYLSLGNMPHYFFPQMNILAGFKREFLDYMYRGVDRLLRDETELIRLLTSYQ